MDASRSPLQLKAFGLDLKVLLTTEAIGGAISVLMGWHKPGEGPPDHVHFGQEEIFFDGFSGAKAMELSKAFDTNFPAPR